MSKAEPPAPATRHQPPTIAPDRRAATDRPGHDRRAAGRPAPPADRSGCPPRRSPAAARTPGTPAAVQPAPPGRRPARRPAGARTAVRRAGRRERQRIVYQPSFIERYRTLIVVVAAPSSASRSCSVFVFFSASQPAYACSTIWTPAPTASPAAGATPALGYVQPDMGHQPRQRRRQGDLHVLRPGLGQPLSTSRASPARSRRASTARTTRSSREGWIHNLEHGALVILYQGDERRRHAGGPGRSSRRSTTPSRQPGLRHAKGMIGPVIARFDQMATPFQAIVWGRVLPLQTFDQAKITGLLERSGASGPTRRRSARPRAAAPTTRAGRHAEPPTPSRQPGPSARRRRAAAPSPS